MGALLAAARYEDTSASLIDFESWMTALIEWNIYII